MQGIFEDIDERRQRQEHLAEVVLRHELSLEASNIGIWDFDLESEKVKYDAQMYRLFDISPEDDRNEVWTDRIHAEDRDALQRAFGAALTDGGLLDVAFRVVWRTGEIRHIRCKGRVVENDHKPVRVVGVNWDVSEAQDKIIELERLNRELDQFAYFASHDLKAPLRHITSFVDLLSESLEDRLEDEEREWLGFVTGGATRMKVLIEDLLGYARSSARSMDLEDVPLAELVPKVMDLVGRDTDDGRVELQVGELPTVHANRNGMALLFQNLLQNAVRYRTPGSAPHIEVSCEETRSHWQLEVRDEGIGVDPKFHERIFAPFQRLDTRSTASSGVGLAICTKIVERHGGRLSVDSELGQGATMRFTIAKSVRAEL